ncbi:hypothetical protein [Amycolatopsis panacis]|uniref:Uncharacterized protein n=1 Tax=Amycolatopsis panacis TaxID=2340917 RepID=A0A419HMY1_9PSEU|nr:hypothetical protein [Amycolatopsis panacis]RJQ77458.1 hypothetical protein D5S19_28955 [Amycolatopsis panacis]
MTIPFFAPGLVANEVPLKQIQEVATTPARKFMPGARTGEFERGQRDAADAIACGGGTSALLPVLIAIGGEAICAPLAASPTSPRENLLFVAALPAFEAGILRGRRLWLGFGTPGILRARKPGTHLYRPAVDLVVVR